MASTAPDLGEQERHEAVDAVDAKAQLLADKIRSSKHLIVFTGAGISTSAGQLARFLTRTPVASTQHLPCHHASMLKLISPSPQAYPTSEAQKGFGH